MQNKLVKTELTRKPLLALTGQYQNGKSTFLNCLLGGNFAAEGNGVVTTKYNAKYSFGDFKSASVLYTNGKTKPLHTLSNGFNSNYTLGDHDKSALLNITAYTPFLANMDILDSPGCSANDEDNKVAFAAIDMADFVVFILQKSLSLTADIPFMRELIKKNKHFTVILNCTDDRAPLSKHSLDICNEIMSKLKSEKLDSNYVRLSDKHPVYPVNLLWAQCALGSLEQDNHKKRCRKIHAYLDAENLDAHELLCESNFFQMRELLSNFVSMFFNYTPSSPLALFSSVTKNWTSALQDVLKEK